MRSLDSLTPKTRKDLQSIFGDTVDDDTLLNICNDYLQNVEGDTLSGMITFFQGLMTNPVAIELLLNPPSQGDVYAGQMHPAGSTAEGIEASRSMARSRHRSGTSRSIEDLLDLP